MFVAGFNGERKARQPLLNVSSADLVNRHFAVLRPELKDGIPHCFEMSLGNFFVFNFSPIFGQNFISENASGWSGRAAVFR
jgi:hypothetical protein